MKQYNPNNQDDFREMELLAYNGNAPLGGLPPPAYWYFHQLEYFSRAYKENRIQKSELQIQRQKLLQQYNAYARQEERCKQVYRYYQENIIAAQEALIKIEKSNTAYLIAKHACECIEHLTGEVGFCARQMKRIEEEK